MRGRIARSANKSGALHRRIHTIYRWLAAAFRRGDGCIQSDQAGACLTEKLALHRVNHVRRVSRRVRKGSCHFGSPFSERVDIVRATVGKPIEDSQWPETQPIRRATMASPHAGRAGGRGNLSARQPSMTVTCQTKAIDVIERTGRGAKRLRPGKGAGRFRPSVFRRSRRSWRRMGRAFSAAPGLSDRIADATQDSGARPQPWSSSARMLQSRPWRLRSRMSRFRTG